MARSILLVLLLGPLLGLAQVRKKNIVKLLCFNNDMLAETPARNNASSFNFTLGYERQFSPRLSVCINYHLFPYQTKEIETPVNYTNGYGYKAGLFTESFWGVGYESRFYYNDFEVDGTSSGYIGFIYDYLKGTQNSDNTTIYDNTGNITGAITYSQQYRTVHKPGIRFGHVWQGVLYSDLYLSIQYNIDSSPSSNWKAPDGIIKPVSMNIGWNIGLPF